MEQGQAVEFTATGGFEYDWSLSQGAWGYLSTLTGSRTVYTSIYNPGTNTTGQTEVQVLTVVSTIQGTSSGNNAASNATYEVTAEAHITHLGTGSPPAEEDPTPANLVVTPSEISIAVNGTQTFSASGGDGSYTWSLQQESWGTLSTRVGDKTTYTSLYDAGGTVSVQVLTVQSDDESFSAFIKHL